MSDRDPTSIDWGQVFAEALEIAHAMRVGDAEDVVQEGMTRVLDGTAPFDPAGELTLAAHLVSVAVTARRNAQRIERLRVRRGTKAKLIQHLDEEPPTPEELTHERRLGERAFEALLAECADDEDVRTLVNLARDEDVDVAQGQADALGWDIGRVRNARKRMDRAVDRVAEKLRAWKEEDVP
jgi:DNA-directed RNA polymerase specialized sigma24 family protein